MLLKLFDASVQSSLDLGELALGVFGELEALADGGELFARIVQSLAARRHVVFVVVVVVVIGGVGAGAIVELGHVAEDLRLLVDVHSSVQGERALLVVVHAAVEEAMREYVRAEAEEDARREGARLTGAFEHVDLLGTRVRKVSGELEVLVEFAQLLELL